MTQKTPLLISPDFPPPLIGGSLVYLFNLLKHAQTPITVMTGEINSQYDEVAGNNIIRKKWLYDSHSPGLLKLSMMYCLLSLWAIYYSLFSRKHSIILLNVSVIGNSLLAFVFKAFGVTTLIFGYAEEITTTLQGRSWKSPLKRFLLKACYRCAKKFVVVCDFAKNTLVSIGIPEEKITVIPPSLSAEKSQKSESVQTKNNFVLSVGRFVPRKGFNYLIEAMQIVKKDIPEASLVCVGGGPDEKLLRDKVDSLGLNDTIKFAIGISDQELSQFYDSCQLFVLANLMLKNGDCEGCPTVLIEASAKGKPVIGGIEGGTSTAIDDGVTGFLIDPSNVNLLADKIKTVLTNSDLAEKMGKAGIEKVYREHKPELNARAFDKELNDLVRQ